MTPILSLNGFEVGQLYVAIGYQGMKSLHPDLQEKIRKAYLDASKPELPKLAVEDVQ